MRKKIRVAVVFGGRSGEHEVSLVSAESIMKALDPKKYEIIPIGINKLGRWITGKNTHALLKSGKIKSNKSQNGIYQKLLQKADVVFPVLHGPYGEDGTVQGFLEMIGIAYVGSGVCASSVCMDKLMTKIILKAYGLPQTQFHNVTRTEVKKEFQKIKKTVARKIGFPCFVKPSNLGSSVGISKVNKPSELKNALHDAAQYDSSILVEKAVDAREIECAVLGNKHPVASVAGEIIPSNEFYDYFAKYVDGASKSLIPAPISKNKMHEVQKLAIAAYKALQCNGMARADFLMDKKTQKLYINELNTIPGFTSISMYPKLWEASGIPYSKLLDRLIELAFDRHREKSRNKISFDSGNEWYKK